MKKATEKLLLIIAELEKNYDLNDYLENYIDVEELEEAIDNDSLQEYLEELDDDGDITRTDVIYYSSAIQYLAENDQSLNESMEIAKEYWYELDSINSELLASLLKSRNNADDYNVLISDIIEKFEG